MANPQGTMHSLYVALKKEGQPLASYFAVGSTVLILYFFTAYCNQKA